jgi:hypothetical protein
MADNDIMVAKQSFATTLDGVTTIVHAGKTRARRGHELVSRNPGAWDRADASIDYDVEDASAMPGVRRAQPPAESKAERAAARVVSEQPKQAGRFKTGHPESDSKQEGSK